MSREDLKCFLNAVNHSAEIRRAIKGLCDNDQEIVKIAKKYGFNITKQDFQDDIEFEKIRSWFKLSEIGPIKRL